MKKIAFIIITLTLNIRSQEQGIEDSFYSIPQDEYPSIVPPASSASALFKFESVPVNQYTGIPNIQIPLYDVSSPDLNLNFKLSYHPNGIGVNEVASEVGLGWSLNQVGMISRTVRGLPDDMLMLSDPSSPEGKIGVFYDDDTGIPNYINKIPLMIDQGTQQVGVDDAPVFFLEFLYNGYYHNKYDTEYDLYQYDILGENGRFIIKKNSEGNLEVEFLNVNTANHKIELNYTHEAVSEEDFAKYNLLGFTITNANGMEFIFRPEDRDITTYSSGSETDFLLFGLTSNSISNGYDYPSSFHLSEIKNYKGVTLAEMTYDDFVENQRSFTFQTNRSKAATNTYDLEQSTYTQSAPMANAQQLPPKNLNSYNNAHIQKKLVSRIDILSEGYVNFKYLSNREDINRDSNSYNNNKLTGVEFYDLHAQKVKDIDFNYDYLQTDFKNGVIKRLILESVEYKDKDNEVEEKVQINYKKHNVDLPVTEDYWGFFTTEQNIFDHTSNRAASKSFCDEGVIERISYSTGGSVEFEFESNTYSYTGDELIQDFKENPDNNFVQEDNFKLTISGNVNQNTASHYFNTQIPSDITNLNPQFLGLSLTTNGGIGWDNENTTLKLKNNLQNTTSGNLICETPDFDGCRYFFDQNTDFNVNHSENLELNYTTFTLENQTQMSLGKIKSWFYLENSKFLYGGGIRIKTIKTFEDSSDSNSIESVKEFSYNSFDNQSYSSGSLVFPKPKFEYEFNHPYFVLWRSPGVSHLLVHNEKLGNIFIKTSTTNVRPFLQTQGGYVGYKNIRVTENDNGYTEYRYTSPIDYPEDISSSNTGRPFIPTKNIDYKRGLLLNKVHYSNSSKKINEIVNTYDFEKEDEILTGFRLFKLLNWPASNFFQNYASYNSLNESCDGTLDADLCSYTTPDAFPGYGRLNTALGWAQLISTEKIQYFYDEDDTSAGSHSVMSEFSYNQQNHKLKSERHIVDNESPLIKTYYYPKDSTLSPNDNNENLSFLSSLVDQNRINSLISFQLSKGSKKLFNVNYLYHDIGSGSGLKEVTQSKGANDLATYSKYKVDDYNQTNNLPLQVSKENGNKVSYIYGYSNSKPIAKLVNISYEDISPSLISSLQSLSDADVDSCMENCSESALRDQLYNLQQSYPSAQITTYTYDPLVGVTSMTDPRGNTVYYKYDSFNRLQQIYDDEQQVIEEYEYNYRSTNQ